MLIFFLLDLKPTFMKADYHFRVYNSFHCLPVSLIHFTMHKRCNKIHVFISVPVNIYIYIELCKETL
jgi:hypothetical protein